MSKKKDIGVFGDPSDLVDRFSGVSAATRTEKSKLGREIKALVKSKATPRDNMRCRGVVRVEGPGDDGRPHSAMVAHVAVGLNGPGRNSDYLAALKRLTDTGRFALLDAQIDAVDDLWDFLFVWQKEA